METASAHATESSLRPMSYLLGVRSTDGNSRVVDSHTRNQGNRRLNNDEDRMRGPVGTQSLERLAESAVNYFDGDIERHPRYRMASDSMTRQR